MTEELDTFGFVLAEALGKTLAEIDTMSNAEYLAWQAFYVYRKAMQDMK